MKKFPGKGRLIYKKPISVANGLGVTQRLNVISIILVQPVVLIPNFIPSSFSINVPTFT